MRRKRLLRARGVALEGGRAGIRVGTPELEELVQEDLLAAREIDERRAARVEGRPPDAGVEEIRELLPVPELVESYRDKAKQFRWVSRRYGVGRARLRRVLEGARVKIRDRGRLRIEERRSSDDVARALRVHDEGGSLRDVAKVLICGRVTALRFLRRMGRVD